MKKRMACISALVLAMSMAACGIGGITAFAENNTTVESSSLEANGNGDAGNQISGWITVDGDLDDWENVPEQHSGDGEIILWKTARDSSGNLYFCFTGNANQYYSNYNWKYLSLKNKNGHDSGFQIVNAQNMTGGTLSIVNTGNHNTEGPYYVELMVPGSYIQKNEVGNISFAGTTVAWNEVPVLDGKAISDSEAEENEKYHGITIDGKFKDWNSVTKYDAQCPNSEHPNCLSEAAMVFDGDYVYIYVKEGKGGTAYGAGSHGNGLFEIKTDLGHRVLLHFHQDGTVTSGTVSDIESRHVGSEWEIAVPANQLPKYKETLSFGLYHADASDPEAFVKNVANLQGGSGNAKEFTGDIINDGNYDDWDGYPHTLIEYATAGTQSDLPDGEGALYSKNDKIYGHVFTEMPDHLRENGISFSKDVKIKLNHDDKKVFSPRLVSVSEDGSINWNPDFNDGNNHEYYIVDTSGGTTAKTLDELKSGTEGNNVYGKMIITLDSSKRHECEFYLDSETLAKKFNLNPNDIRFVGAQFGKIGQQWIETSGASTGPLLGVILCVGVTALALYRKKMFPFGI